MECSHVSVPSDYALDRWADQRPDPYLKRSETGVGTPLITTVVEIFYNLFQATKARPYNAWFGT